MTDESILYFERAIVKGLLAEAQHLGSPDTFNTEEFKSDEQWPPNSRNCKKEIELVQLGRRSLLSHTVYMFSER